MNPHENERMQQNYSACILYTLLLICVDAGITHFCCLYITHYALCHGISKNILRIHFFSVRVRVWELFFLNALKETVMVFCVRQLFQVNLH